MFSSRTPCSGASGRGRAAVLWGVAFLVLGQLGLDLALHEWWPLRDPEFGWRLVSLKARIAERAPAKPVVVFLGSSRVATEIRPGLLPAAHNASPGGPVVFNCGMTGVGPIVELLTLRRLLAAGVHPDCLFVEVWPAIAAATAEGQVKLVPHERMHWRDLAVLRPYLADPKRERREWWKDQAEPWLALRTRLLNQWAPSWVGPTQRNSVNWDNLDRWGWLSHTILNNSDGMGRWRVDAIGKGYIPMGNQFAPSDDSMRAFAELFALCRREKITVSLVAMPDGFLPGYLPAGRRRMDDFLRRLSTDNDASLIDARAWSPLDDYYDGVHLTLDGAAAFTERFGREVLQPYLAGEPLTRRWPPGVLHGPPTMQWGAGFLAEEHAGPTYWRWSGGKGEAAFFNPSDHPQRVSLHFTARTPWAAPAKLSLESSFLSKSFSVDMNGTVVDQIVELPPGEQVLHFDCDGKTYEEPAPAGAAPRGLVFEVVDFRCAEDDRGGTELH